MSIDPDVRPHMRPPLRHREIVRAIADIGRTLGWTVLVGGTRSSPSRPRQTAGPDTLFGPHLILVHSGHRRLVHAWVTSQRVSPHRVRLAAAWESLGRLAWDRSSDEQERAERAIGKPVPSIEFHFWRPQDVETGVITDVLAATRRDTPEHVIPRDGSPLAR